MSRLLLVRHGQIDANLEHRWHGSTDRDLTAQGREEARRVATHLARTRPRIAAVYSSPLLRAQTTAAVIADAFNHPVLTLPGLAEYGIGILENETFEDLLGRHRFFDQAGADLRWAPPGGESLHEVGERVVAAWRHIAGAHRDREIIVVSHGAAIAIGLAIVLHDDARAWIRYRMRNTGITEVHLEPEPRLVAFDVGEHLEDEPR
jgi:probable phosphoglycerate mutase